MPLCSFSESYLLLGVTPVENIFIQEYLPRASGDYVRVYLYGLMQCHHPGEDMSLERMAHLLDLSEDVVKSAFSYWERQGLVQRVSDNPPSYQYLNLTATAGNESPLEKAIYRHRDFNNKLQQLFGNRLLHPAEFMTACEWVEDLNLPEEVVLVMVEHFMAGKGKSFQFRQLNKEALQWAEKGIDTLQAANEMIMRDSAAYKMSAKVLNQFNIRRAPTKDEINLARKWLEEWKLDEEAVLVACRETVKGRNPSFGYLDGILARNHTARSSEDMESQLNEKQTIENAIKAIHEALGIRQMAPTPAEITAYQNYMAANFEPNAVLKIAQAMGGSGRYTMEDFNRKVTQFMERDQMTERAVDDYLDQQKLLRGQVSEIYELSGQDSPVNKAAVDQMEEWLQSSSYPLIRYAAECARGTKLPVQYISKLLRDWKKADITTADQARRQRAASPAAVQTQKPVPTALQYSQRTYSEEDFKKIAGDIARFMEEDDQ